MKTIKLCFTMGAIAALGLPIGLHAQAAPVPPPVPVAPVPLAEPAPQAAETQTLLLHHARPVDIIKLMHWDHLANLPIGVTQILSLPAKNALAVNSTPAGFAKVRDIVKTLDIEQPQVQIKFALANASDADLKTSGIEFELAPLTEPGLNPLFVIYATGSPAVRFSQALTTEGDVIQRAVITTTNNVWASANVSNTLPLPTQEAASFTFAVTPHVNGDNSVTLALHPVFLLGGITHEINALRTVNDGGTIVIVMPPVASQADGKNLLLFVTPTVKVK